MEQIRSSRGPSEVLHEDPASLRSPAEGLAETYIDLQMNIKLMENTDEPEDIIPALESVDEATVHILADEAALAAGPGGRVACIASPGVYHSLKEAHPDHKNDLFVDFDPRFRGENTLIIPLDGDKPLAEHLPSQLQHAFQVVVVDATFLDFLPLDKILDVARLLSLLHEPLKVILVAPEEKKGTLEKQGLHMAKQLRPHGRHGPAVRVFTSIPNPKRLR